jgi:hypothetical protein
VTVHGGSDISKHLLIAAERSRTILTQTMEVRCRATKKPSHKNKKDHKAVHIFTDLASMAGDIAILSTPAFHGLVYAS